MRSGILFEVEPFAFESYVEEAGEIGSSNRSRGDYIKWVQQSLNQLMGLRLAVDGVSGTQTRSAIRSFQQRQGLVADGIVGPVTEAAIKAALAAASGVDAATAQGTAPSARSGETCNVLDNFDFDRDQLKAAHQSQVEAVAGQVTARRGSAQPIRTIRITGHTDPVGAPAYNKALGQRRAKRVAQALREAMERRAPGSVVGITFDVQSRGEDEPLSADPRKNRRVEVCVPKLVVPAGAQCGAAPVSAEDPLALTVSAVGQLDYTGGPVTILGRTLSVKGSVFYPSERDGRGTPFNTKAVPAPIVFIAHGNHAIFHNPANRNDERCADPGGFRPIPNHAGYDYLQRLLARMGIIAVSVDCNEVSGCIGLSPTNIRQRAELILASVRHFIQLKSGGDRIFGNRIDFSRLGLLGHSRGGEAVVVVPEIPLPAGATIKGVISLAPTDAGASSGRPTGYPLMMILPAGDGDVVTNEGARFYDQAAPAPFKCQLYLHRANHNFFNRQWPADDGQGPAVMSRPDHESILSAYGCAFFRQVLLRHNFATILTGQELAPGVPGSNIHVSAELSGATTVDDHENRNISVNTLGKATTQSDGLTAAEFDFAQGAPGAFNNTFFGNTVGMVARTTKVTGTFKSQLGRDVDLGRREIWIRAAEVFDGTSVPASGANFELGLEDARGRSAFVDVSRIGGLLRPYDRQDAFTKTMLKTMRFPASCFGAGGSGFDISKVRAVLVRLNKQNTPPVAFDQLQIVSP